MPKPRIRTVRNPVTPRKSVISGRTVGRDGNLIDIGAPPINRHGVVYITELEARYLAEHIGWVDGDLAREEIGRLQEENTRLRAQIAEVPLATNLAKEAFHDGLEPLVAGVLAGYDARLLAAAVPELPALPAFVTGVRAEADDDAGRDPQSLVLLDGSDRGDDPADVGGQQVAAGGDDEHEPADGDGAPRGDQPLGGAAAAGSEGDGIPAGGGDATVRAPDRRPARITDLDADADDQPPGN